VRIRRWGVLLAVVVLLVPAGLASAAPPTPTERPGGPERPATTGALSANATAVVIGGNWNCGQGTETVDLFGRAIDGVGPYQYQWSFGDGSPPSAAQDPVHTYTDLTGVTANLTVTDSNHSTARTQIYFAWSIPPTCSTAPASDWAGIVLYVVLVVAVAAGIAFAVRRRRSPPIA
jgi:PKD domain-containing protein